MSFGDFRNLIRIKQQQKRDICCNQLQAKMKLIFCHDHFFVKNHEGAIFSPGQYSVHTWKRYTRFFDSMLVVARLRMAGPGDILENMNEVEASEISFEFLPSLSSPRAILTQRPVATRKLKELISGSDAVIVRLPSEIGLLAARIAEDLGKPWAVELVACPWDALWNHGSLMAKLYAPIAAYRVRQCVRKTRFCLYVTEKFLQYRYPSSGHMVAVSNVELTLPSQIKLHSRVERIRRQGSKLILGQSGSLTSKIKGLQYTLKALSRLSRLGYDFELRVLGPGDVSHWRESAARHGLVERVCFDGVRPSGAPVVEWLDDIDIFLQPSLQEGLPRSLIEAMSRGCPAIASTAGGIPELLPKDALHAPGDWRHQATLIADLCSDPQQMEAHATRNFQRAKSFDKTSLDRLRSDFWHLFHQHIQKIDILEN